MSILDETLKVTILDQDTYKAIYINGELLDYGEYDQISSSTLKKFFNQFGIKYEEEYIEIDDDVVIGELLTQTLS